MLLLACCMLAVKEFLEEVLAVTERASAVEEAALLFLENSPMSAAAAACGFPLSGSCEVRGWLSRAGLRGPSNSGSESRFGGEECGRAWTCGFAGVVSCMRQ